MAAYQLSAAQRATFDEIVARAVEAGRSLLDDVAEKAGNLLVSTRAPWAVVFARDRFFKRYVKNALLRLKAEGRVQHGRKGRNAWWTPASLGAKERQATAGV